MDGKKQVLIMELMNMMDQKEPPAHSEPEKCGEGRPSVEVDPDQYKQLEICTLQTKIQDQITRINKIKQEKLQLAKEFEDEVNRSKKLTCIQRMKTILDVNKY